MRALDRPLDGKTAIITAAASGIGRASALQFAQAGATVIVADIAADAVRAVAAEIAAQGGRALAVPTDVTAAEQVAELIGTAIAKFGTLDILFNNAGGAFPQPTHSMAVADYHRIIALNLDSVFFGIHAALPVMLEQGRGCILATTSGAGLNAVNDLAVYGAAKAGVISLMKSIAVEYGGRGIRANTLSPGPMDTPGLRAWLDTFPDGAARYAAQIPSGRLGAADDIAAAAVFLAGDAAAFINGAVLPIDGAIHARLATPQIS